MPPVDIEFHFDVIGRAVAIRGQTGPYADAAICAEHPLNLGARVGKYEESGDGAKHAW